MKKYNVIIIDDERNVREALVILLKKYCPQIHVCGVAESASEGRALLEENNVDFIFLDILMPKEDGFTFLSTINSSDYEIIFATAHEEHALRAIKANAIEYLLKPIDPDELQIAVRKAISNHENRKQHVDARDVYAQSIANLQESLASNNGKITKIIVYDLNGFRLVELSEIVYLEAESNYTFLHLTGHRKVTTSKSLGEYEKILVSPEFYRIHKSFIINMKYLIGYTNTDGNFAELSGDIRLSISRRKVLEFRDIVQANSMSIG